MAAVLVTGAAGGMGRAVCHRLHEAGYTVFGLDIAPQPPEMTPWHYLQTDLTDASQVTAAYEKVAAQTDRLYALVHMAGIYDLNSLVEMTEQEFTRIFEINLMACFRVNRSFLPLLQEGSRILITTSELAPLDPLPFTGIYGISKTALERYADALRMELQLLGIRVSVLRPGAVKTGLLSVSTGRLDDFVENTTHYTCNAERFRRIVDRVEAKNIPPEKIAALVERALGAKRPRLCYNINRNPLLRLLHLLPLRTQVWIIGRILKA